MPHSPLANPSATREVLTSFGLAQRKRLGQHFLVDDGVLGRTLELAAIGADDVVLEVGPGIGTLTLALCERAGAVVAVERDERLLPVLRETTAGCDRLAVVQADAARVGLQEIAAPFGEPTALVANLPYEVAATVVLRCFEEMPSVQSVTAMVQAEVADRMAATVGTKDYGAYTVKLSLRAQVSGRFAVGRGCFMPPPRVDSAVIRLERRESDLAQDVVEAASKTARAAFAQRRKTLRNSLASALEADKAVVDRALSFAGVDGEVRAETLDPVVFVEIALGLREQGILP